MPSKESLKQHIRMDPICDKVEEPAHDDRVCKQWLKNLNLNQLPFSQASSPSKKWSMLYNKIFPGEGDIPPCCKNLMEQIPLLHWRFIDDEPGLNAAEERRFFQLLEQKAVVQFGTKISKRMQVLIEECKQEMQGMPSNTIRKYNENGDIQLSTLETSSVHPTSTSKNPNSSHDMDTWSNSNPVELPLYQTYLDQPIESQFNRPSTLYHPWLEWPSVSSSLECDEIIQPPMHEEQRNYEVDNNGMSPESTIKDSLEGPSVPHVEDDLLFESFLYFTHKPNPRDGGWWVAFSPKYCVFQV